MSHHINSRALGAPDTRAARARRGALVRNAVRHHGLELHGAILDATTGEVEFIGRHPQEAELMNEERQPRSFLTLRSDD